MATDPNIRVLKARIQDARDIFDLVNSLSGDGTLLRRSYAEICENIRDFTVVSRATPEGETEFLGCGALHLYGPHLAEVRSIVVKPEYRGIGAGGRTAPGPHRRGRRAPHPLRLPLHPHPRLLRAPRASASPNATPCPTRSTKTARTCPRLYACDEVAMVRGPLPKVARPRAPANSSAQSWCSCSSLPPEPVVSARGS